jgi:hypothetical protein
VDTSTLLLTLLLLAHLVAPVVSVVVMQRRPAAFITAMSYSHTLLGAGAVMVLLIAMQWMAVGYLWSVLWLGLAVATQWVNAAWLAHREQIDMDWMLWCVAAFMYVCQVEADGVLTCTLLFLSVFFRVWE